jgi:hypothetical protein
MRDTEDNEKKNEISSSTSFPPSPGLLCQRGSAVAYMFNRLGIYRVFIIRLSTNEEYVREEWPAQVGNSSDRRGR